jgi:hypothetical protein
LPDLGVSPTRNGEFIVIGRPYVRRQAKTLLEFAKSTNNPKLAAVLVEKAADLTARVDEATRPDVTPLAPDIEQPP